MFTFAKQKPADTVATLTRRIEELEEARGRAEVERRHRAEALEQARREAAQLTEQAAAGKLKNPQKLAEALQRVRQLEAEPQAPDVAGEIAQLQNERAAAEREAAMREYLSAVQQYAAAAAPLVKLAADVKEKAERAGVFITVANSPGLLGRELAIGGAIVEAA